MKTQISEKTRSLLEDCWRLTPARMAEHLTGGRFQRYRHVRFLENKIAQAITRGGARLIISMPPRHGKSWLGSLFTPAWFFSLWPARNVILTSHDSALAAAWGRRVREFLTKHEAALGTVQGELITAGVGHPISGGGGNLIIVDDPLKSWNEACSENTRQRHIDWFNSTLCTRAEPGASIIVIMTRWHERDLAGYLQTERGNEWQVLRIPAIAEDELPGAPDLLGRAAGVALCEERFGLDALAKVRAEVGSRVWNALYQQRPGSEQGSMIKRSWWRYYRELPHSPQSPDSYDEILQSWDMSFKGTSTSDYVVGQVWGRKGADKYLIDQVRGKMDFTATLTAVRQLSEKYPQAHRKLIEDKANGCAVLSTLKDSIPGLIVVQPNAGKQARVNAIAAEIESGNVYLPTPETAPWIEEFVSECSDFPNGRHDDQVDAMAYALKNWKQGA